MGKTGSDELNKKVPSALKMWFKDTLNALKRNDRGVEITGKNELEDQRIEDGFDVAKRLYDSRLGEIRDVVNNLLERGNGKDLYNLLASCGFDKEGLHLYWSAEEIAGFSIHNMFQTEYELGHFKEMNGHERLKWVEIGRFATGEEYEHLPGDHKLLKSYNSIDQDSAKYLKYQKELWPLAVRKVMDDIELFELDTNSMENILTRLNEFQNEPHTCITDEDVQKKEEEESRLFVSYHEQVKDIIDNLLEHKDAKEIYEFLTSCSLDEEGFTLYRSAKEMLKFDVYSFFYTEDNLGYFEDMDGHELLKWVEIGKFATNREYEYFSCYEQLKSYSMDCDSPEYLDYRKALWLLAVRNVIDGINPHTLDIKPLENLLTQLTAFQNGENIKPLEREQVQNVYFQLQQEMDTECEENEMELE